MNNSTKQNIIVAGVSFKTTELLSRSRFAFNADACRDTYKDSAHRIPFFILSTCNRTEIYAWSADAEAMKDMLKAQGECTVDELNDIVYIKQGTEAIDHFFRVAAGLESQIVGDYEIISQIKTAFKLAKDFNRSNGILEKMYNFALQSSKQVKNDTSFSDGTLSVPYAAIRQLAGRREIKNITVAGAGETGELVIKYIRDHLPDCNIRLVNRDEDKLHHVGSKYDVMQFPIAALEQSLIDADALIVATNAATPLVHREHVGERLKVIFDLSVPRNVSSRVYKMNSIQVLDVDAISESIQHTKSVRLLEIPRVEKIISNHTAAFNEWMRRREEYSI